MTAAPKHAPPLLHAWLESKGLGRWGAHAVYISGTEPVGGLPGVLRGWASSPKC